MGLSPDIARELARATRRPARGRVGISAPPRRPPAPSPAPKPPRTPRAPEPSPWAQKTPRASTADASRPIRTLIKAQAKIARTTDPQERAALRESTRALRHALASQAAYKASRKTPEGSPVKADLPEAALKAVAPRAYRKAFEAASAGGHGSSRGAGEPEDLTTAITLAAPGGGLAGDAVAKGLEEVGGKLASRFGTRAAAKVASEAEQTATEDVAKGALGKLRTRAAESVRTKVDRVKATPERVRTAPARAARNVREAPARAREAATTAEGRRAAAKGAARGAAHHPIRTGVPVAAASPIPLPGEANKRASAFLEGTAAALTHPGKVAETTAKGALGAFAVPWDLGGATLASIKQGSPAPLTSTVGKLAGGAVQMAGNLASGNPHKVEETTLHETGLTPFIPLGALGKAAKDTHFYDDLRSSLRDTVEGKRAAERIKRVEAEAKVRAEGGRVAKRPPRPGRTRTLDQKPIHDSVAVTDENGRPTGQHYVLRRTGARIEKQRDIHYVAREVDRIGRKGDVWSHDAARPILKALRKSPLVNHDPVNAADALSVVVDHGISRDPVTGMSQIKEIAHSIKKASADDPADVTTLRHSVRWIEDNPAIFRDQHFWKAVDAFKKQSEEVGFSARKRYLASLKNVVNPRRAREGRAPILTPEEMVTPEAARLLPKKLDGEWSRSEALNYLEDLKKSKDGRIQARAAALQDALTTTPKGENLMLPPERGGAEHGISTTQALAYTPEMRQRFVAQMEAEHAAHGYETPAAYVAHKLPSKFQPEGISIGQDARLRKIWPEQGKAIATGNTETSFESLMKHSVFAPRQRVAMATGLDRIFARAARKVNGENVLTRSGVERALINHEVPAGTVFVRPQVIKNAIMQAGERPVSDLIEEEIENGQRLASSSPKGLRDNLLASEKTKGEKFTPMNAAMLHELLGHTRRLDGGLNLAAHATNGASRAILNSPAFLAIRFTHEIPAAMALGHAIVDVPAALKNLRTISKFPAETRAELASIWGTSPGLLSDPVTKELRADAIRDPIRAAAKPRVWKQFWDVLNGNLGGAFDRARTAKARETIGLAKFQHDFRVASSTKGFTAWRRSAHNIFRDEKQAVETMKGMTLEERLAYVSAHPRLGDKLMRDMTSNVGNFTSLTSFEKKVAPLTLFYSFQRYTVMWTLYHFPLDHPVVATALNWLGQAHNKELEKALGEEPSLLQSAYGVFQNPGSHATVLPGALRASPLTAGVQSAALAGKPTQLLSELSPEFQIPITAIEGTDPYTGEPVKGGRLGNALREVASLSPALRLAGVSDLGKGKSYLGEAFSKQDPLREARSVLDPFIGQSIGQLRRENKLGAAVERKYGKGHVPGPFDSALVQELLYGGKNGTPQPQLLPKVLEEIHHSEGASNYVKKAESSLVGPEKPFSSVQKGLLKAVEEAWKSGPGSTASNPWAGTSSTGVNPWAGTSGTSANPWGG